MTHGHIEPADWQNLISVRPGPVIHVWRGGADYCAIPLTHTAALTLIGSLVAAMQMSNALPREGLAFDAHLAIRDAEREAVK